MKKFLSLFLTAAVLLSAFFMFPTSFAAEDTAGGMDEDDITATLTFDDTVAVLDEPLDIEADEAAILNAESYTLETDEKQLLEITTSAAAYDARFSAEFAIPETTKTVFIAGLTAQAAEEIQEMLLSAYLENRNFELERLDFIDTEKTRDTDDDDELCWAASTSDILIASGWAQKAGFFNEDDLFEDFIHAFTNAGGNIGVALGWFFNGTNMYGNFSSDYPRVKEYPNSGKYLADYAFDRLYTEERVSDVAGVKRMTDALHQGNAVTIGANIYQKSTGAFSSSHAMTLFGYIIDEAYDEDRYEYFDSFILADSDSHELRGVDRRRAKNIYTVYSVSERKLSSGSAMSFSDSTYIYILDDYAALIPYSGEVEKETDAAAKKDKINYTDLAIDSAYLGENSGVQSFQKTFSESAPIFFSPVVNNYSDKTASGTVSTVYSVKNSRGDVVKSGSYNMRMNLPPLYHSSLTGYIDLSGLSPDSYTVSCTVNSTKSLTEAYYYNNSFDFTFTVEGETPIEPETYLLGDANGDGIVNVTDATVIQRVLAMLKKDEDGRIAIRGDVNGNGLEILDATRIQRYLARYATAFDIGKTKVFA